jgi:glucokinase
MADLARSVTAEIDIAIGQVAAMGVGSPGPLSTRERIVYSAPNLPGWKNVPVTEILSKKLNCPVVLENDANAAAYAENWVGAGREASSMIMLTLGTGIGGGVVLNGEVWHGRDDAAGELGHMSINFNGPRCACGSYGCIEAYASAPNTVRRAMEGLEQGRDSTLRNLLDRGDEFTAKAIYDAAVDGDAYAREIIEETGTLLGIAVANFVNIFNPELVVFFGGLANAGEMLFEPTRCEAKRRALKPASETVKIVPAQLKKDAGIIGAAGCALKTLETSAL